MQNIYFIDNDFIKENSTQYILSIRYSTDGLSFCVHNIHDKLIAFFHQPYTLDTKDAVMAKVKKTIAGEELLSLRYKKAYILPCNKEKTLIPAHIFNKDYLSDMYRICLCPEKNDTLLYRKIRVMESYIVEAIPRNFITFLTSRYQSLCVVNSAYPFIINSLSNTLLNANHLFLDIQDRYFDILLTRNNDVLLFNSFTYSSVPDLVYYILSCLKACNVGKDSLQTVISGTLTHDTGLFNTLNNYLPNISVLNDASLNATIKNNELNSSCFVHLLSLHRCE